MTRPHPEHVTSIILRLQDYRPSMFTDNVIIDGRTVIEAIGMLVWLRDCLPKAAPPPAGAASSAENV